ncbi:MAG: tRNA ((37)-N6)-threonylcarbamoyltransferase complex dimerization subunit type 1 TsaB [Bacteroidota bacterium]|jgi:tRNA threonylcarbamoyladenosine biosynthesis protein TsaB
MFFLLIETSHSKGSISLFEDSVCLEETFLEGDFKHAELLAVGVQGLLNRHELDAEKISAVGISDGPGSYTGLRIGASWAKGFCLPTSTPLIACSETKALMAATRNHQNVLCIIDARRMEVFGEWMDENGNSNGTQAWILDETLVTEWQKKNPNLAGDGVDKLIENFPFSWRDSFIRFADSRHLFHEFIQKWESKQFENIFSYEPNYVKPVFLVPSKK